MFCRLGAVPSKKEVCWEPEGSKEVATEGKPTIDRVLVVSKVEVEDLGDSTANIISATFMRNQMRFTAYKRKLLAVINERLTG